MKGREVIKAYLNHVILATAEYDCDEDEEYFSSYYYKKDNNIWLQFTSNCLNVLYPFKKEPFSKFDELEISYKGLTIGSWKKELYLTLDFENNLEEVSQFVVAYFKEVFNIEINDNTFDYVDYVDYPESEDDDLLNP